MWRTSSKFWQSSSHRRMASPGYTRLWADYLCAQADLGFFSELPNPGAEMISVSGCEHEPALAQLVQEVRDAFQEESFLFKEA